LVEIRERQSPDWWFVRRQSGDWRSRVASTWAGAPASSKKKAVEGKLLVLKFASQGLVDLTPAGIIRIIEKTVEAVAIVKPARVINDRVKTYAADRLRSRNEPPPEGHDCGPSCKIFCGASRKSWAAARTCQCGLKVPRGFGDVTGIGAPPGQKSEGGEPWNAARRPILHRVADLF
jgi:hypothetical protein